MRLFTEHIKRKTFLLDGLWDYAIDEKDIGEEKQWFRHFPYNAEKTAVPACINTRFGYINFQSIIWYKKDFYAEGNVAIKFNAVTEFAKVYLDGEYLGEHYGGFTAFEFEKKLKPGIHSLVVRVDSSSNEDTIPLWEVDWHHYCGIIRSVEVSCFNDVAIKAMRAEYELSDELTAAEVKIYVKLKNYLPFRCTKLLSVNIDNEKVYSNTVEIDEEEEICASFVLKNIRLWELDSGNLYTITVQTDNDDLIDKTGFRKIEVKGKGIYLNNKRISIMGVNRHEEHPDWGFAMPPQLNVKDMDILKNLGVNAVRGSHYPNTQLFVDMCDAEGILFWSEIPMWGFEKESLDRSLVIARGLNMHAEMVNQYYNHPSIIIWGMHNEIATDSPQGYSITEKFVKYVKSIDNSRLVTYATNRILKDDCLKLVDFISVNQYVGWYEGDIEDWEGFMSDMKNSLKEKGVGDKPIVMSEFGVGAIFGNKNFEELRWSENYQVKFYKHTLDLFLNDNDISGVYLWQFADIRSNAKWSLLRARSFNNKGLVNEYRQPKLSYYAVKEMFENERDKRRRC